MNRMIFAVFFIVMLISAPVAADMTRVSKFGGPVSTDQAVPGGAAVEAK